MFLKLYMKQHYIIDSYNDYNNDEIKFHHEI